MVGRILFALATLCVLYTAEAQLEQAELHLRSSGGAVRFGENFDVSVSRGGVGVMKLDAEFVQMNTSDVRISGEQRRDCRRSHLRCPSAPGKAVRPCSSVFVDRIGSRKAKQHKLGVSSRTWVAHSSYSPASDPLLIISFSFAYALVRTDPFQG